MTLPLRPPVTSTLQIISLYGRWSTSGSDRGIAQFFTATKKYHRGNRRKKNKHLGLTQVKKESYVILCMCRLTLVWTLAKLAQSSWNADSIFFHWSGPSLMPTHLSAPVSGVDWSLVSPFANSFSVLLSHSQTGVPSLLPVTRDRGSKTPLSGFAPKQTKESSAWRTTYIVLHLVLFLRCHHWFVWLLKSLKILMIKTKFNFFPFII